MTSIDGEMGGREMEKEWREEIETRDGERGWGRTSAVESPARKDCQAQLSSSCICFILV